jgi:hypothetical protein
MAQATAPILDSTKCDAPKRGANLVVEEREQTLMPFLSAEMFRAETV